MSLSTSASVILLFNIAMDGISATCRVFERPFRACSSKNSKSMWRSVSFFFAPWMVVSGAAGDTTNWESSFVASTDESKHKDTTEWRNCDLIRGWNLLLQFLIFIQYLAKKILDSSTLLLGTYPLLLHCFPHSFNPLLSHPTQIRKINQQKELLPWRSHDHSHCTLGHRQAKRRCPSHRIWCCAIPNQMPPWIYFRKNAHTSAYLF